MTFHWPHKVWPWTCHSLSGTYGHQWGKGWTRSLLRYLQAPQPSKAMPSTFYLFFCPSCHLPWKSEEVPLQWPMSPQTWSFIYSIYSRRKNSPAEGGEQCRTGKSKSQWWPCKICQSGGGGALVPVNSPVIKEGRGPEMLPQAHSAWDRITTSLCTPSLLQVSFWHWFHFPMPRKRSGCSTQWKSIFYVLS